MEGYFALLSDFAEDAMRWALEHGDSAGLHCSTDSGGSVAPELSEPPYFFKLAKSLLLPLMR